LGTKGATGRVVFGLQLLAVNVSIPRYNNVVCLNSHLSCIEATMLRLGLGKPWHLLRDRASIGIPALRRTFFDNAAAPQEIVREWKQR
jgi:hypothetical protein